jgi:DNA excision repair protein ERCC-4
MTMPRPPRPSSDEPLVTPFVVLVDQQEGIPYRFEGIIADARQGRRPLVVPTETVHLKTADYTIRGLESRVAVERKGGAQNGAEDLFRTIGQGRERFERELARMNEMEVAAVVVEAEWSQILTDPPKWSKLPPKNVYRSCLAWQQRFPRVHWWTVAGRKMGEVTTFRILERFWRDRVAREEG